MPLLMIPPQIRTNIEAHKQWLSIVKKAQCLVDEDKNLQENAARSLRLKERTLPPEVLGRNYAQYCVLINNMYDAYLNSVHMQRSPFILEIVSIFLKRVYELRNELTHIIVNDYIYVDSALTQMRMTPYDIQIVVPYHAAMERRPDSMEQLLQAMWSDAVKRKNAPPPKVKPPLEPRGSDEAFFPEEPGEPSQESLIIEASVHTIVAEEFIQACIIQKLERFRQYYVQDVKSKNIRRRTFFAKEVVEPPLELKIKAATLIQNIYRTFMRIKRQRVLETKRDILLGITPDPFRDALNFDEENNKMYDRRIEARRKIEESYKREMARENVRLIIYKKEDQIDDITEQVREWFKEWYYGYGFFPEFPFDLEGGTLIVMTGDYPSIEEKMEEDEKYLAATKGKTKDQLKEMKEQAKLDAALKAEAAKEAKKREAEILFKAKCNPFSDPGYQVQQSAYNKELADVLEKYRSAWSVYDRFPPESCAETIYGYIKPLLTEDLMCQLHKECRKYVDELMRLDLKLLIKMQQLMYKNVGWKYPKQKPRKAPKVPPVPKPLKMDSAQLKSLEQVFDLGLITKPTTRIKDILGDLSFAAYDLNVLDPNASFPLPAYGDVRRRLLLSCVLASGIEPGSKRNKAVLLVGPPRNGKSFLADCIAGEMNGVKIDISPALTSAVVDNAGKVLSLAFTAAKVFQPAVIYCRDIEKVFAKKVDPKDRFLRANKLKKSLTKLIKTISYDYKVIFIASSSFPNSANVKPMMALFTESLLVPRMDYGTLRTILYNKLLGIKSMPRDVCVQAISQLLQGYGSGVVTEVIREVLSPERIVRLNVTPLSPSEFLEPLLLKEIEPVSVEDYKEYSEFVLLYSPYQKEREEYAIINRVRNVMYIKEKREKST